MLFCAVSCLSQGVTFPFRVVIVRAHCSWPARRETRRSSSTCWLPCHALWCSPHCRQYLCMQQPNKVTPTSCSCWRREAVILIRWVVWHVRWVESDVFSDDNKAAHLLHGELSCCLLFQLGTCISQLGTVEYQVGQGSPSLPMMMRMLHVSSGARPCVAHKSSVGFMCLS